MFVIKSVSVCMSKKMSTFLHCVRARFEVSQGPPVSNEKVSVCHKLSSLFLSSVGTPHEGILSELSTGDV